MTAAAAVPTASAAAACPSGHQAWARKHGGGGDRNSAAFAIHVSHSFRVFFQAHFSYIFVDKMHDFDPFLNVRPFPGRDLDLKKEGISRPIGIPIQYNPNWNTSTTFWWQPIS